MSTNKTNNLKVVDSNETEPRKTAWEEKQQDLKITRQKLQQRVAALRMELEAFPGPASGSTIRYSQ